jgi:hypothetical protein
MFIRKSRFGRRPLPLFFHAEGEGGGGGGGGAKTYTQEEFDAEVKGLKTKNDELLGKNKKLTDSVTGLQESMKAFDGIDPKAVREMMAVFHGNEEMQLLKDGKFDEVVNRRTSKLTEAHQAELKKREEMTAAEKARADKFLARVRDNALRSAAIEAGVHKSAIDDILLHGAQVFTVNDGGDAVMLKDGEVVLGKDGKTPFSPTEWLTSLEASKPHWFPNGNAGAPQGGKPGAAPDGTTKRTMKRSQFDALTDPTERMEAAKKFRIID